MILAVPAIAGHEERLRKFASVLRALPDWPAQPAVASGEQKDYGIAVRSLGDQSQTFLEIANDTPYPIRLAGLLDAPAAANVEDLGRNFRLVPQAAPGASAACDRLASLRCLGDPGRGGQGPAHRTSRRIPRTPC